MTLPLSLMAAIVMVGSARSDWKPDRDVKIINGFAAGGQLLARRGACANGLALMNDWSICILYGGSSYATVLAGAAPCTLLCKT